MKGYVDVFSLADILTAYFSAADTYSNSDFQLSPEKAFPPKFLWLFLFLSVISQVRRILTKSF
jgi:hypothetical protein